MAGLDSLEQLGVFKAPPALIPGTKTAKEGSDLGGRKEGIGNSIYQRESQQETDYTVSP